MKTQKIIAFSIFFLLSKFCCAQFTDNFSDGDFTSKPAWSGDNSKFIINSGKLKLQAPGVAETAFLSTSSQAIHDGSWEFYLQMDFNPSSTNYSKIYLVSDQSVLNAALNGYFIKAGNTSRDVSLYRQTGTTETKIIDGLDDRLNLPIVKLKIRATRSTTGMWQLFSDVGPSGVYTLEGTFTDNTYTVSSYFGIFCTYTSTRSDKFWFDDFIVTGTPVPDTTPPIIQTVTVVSQQQVSLLFSEPIEPTASLNTANFIAANLGMPASMVLLQDQKTLQLNFSAALVNGVTYLLQVSGIKDLAGNTITPITVNVLFFHAVPVKNKDIIFTEILPDPSPQIGLPNAEFVEIYNRSQDPFNLIAWKLSDGNSTGIFPSQIILPGEYWIVTAASSTNLFVSSKTIGLSNFPTLNNSGDVITIKNSTDLTIDSVNYNLDWYHDPDKQEGGWTLELIDPNNPCGEENNWTASEDPKGGTPGKQNSVFANKPDLTSPVMLAISPELPTRLDLTFNEKLDPGSLSLENFTINQPITFSKAFFKDISLKTIVLELMQSLETRQKYTLAVKNVSDCSANVMQSTSMEFGLPEKPDSLDVVVNEVLFNPRSGGADFVEVFNSSPKFLNLKNWKLGNYDGGIPTNITVLFSDNRILPPYGYAVFTTDPHVVKSQYPQSIEQNIFKTSLPVLRDDKSSIVMLDDTGKILDELSYSKDWHSEFIKNDEGVSLERISVKGPTNDPDSWTSASSMEGFATPGFANSQFRTEQEAGEGDVLIVPEIFSPNERTNDFTQIQYHFDQGGWVANVKVYDHQGHQLKIITNNETLGPEGFFRWDGDRDDGSKARMGYYVVWFEIFNAKGAIKTFRKRVIVSTR